MKDAIKMMESTMPPDAVKRAQIQAEQEILTIRLAQLRESQNKTQAEMTSFSQSSISKIEGRKDIIDYLDNLGMGLEIRACSKASPFKDTVLLKI